MSRECQATVLEWLMSKILTQTGFTFFHACVICPISSNWERVSLAMFYKIIAAIWCKWIIDDSPCFGVTWCIVPKDFTIRKNLLKQGIRVVRWSKWQTVLHLKIRNHNLGINYLLIKLCCTIPGLEKNIKISSFLLCCNTHFVRFIFDSLLITR